MSEQSGEDEQARHELLARLREIDGLVRRGMKKSFDAADAAALWAREEGEALWPVAIAVGGALAMQIALPNDLELPPPWLLPVIGAALGIALLVSNGRRRIAKKSKYLRQIALALTGVLGLANAYSAIRLIEKLLTAGEGDAVHLLRVGGSIWLTNVIVFALLYWEFDSGGPLVRLEPVAHPDFLFPQFQDEEHRFSPEHWTPAFVDYFYFSFTNATAFSPTDVMPLSSWAKLTMLVQSAVSLATVALVIARAVNILK